MANKNVGLDLGKGSIKYVTEEKAGDIPSWFAKGRIAQVVGAQNGVSFSYKGQDYVIGRDAILGSGFSWSSAEDKDDFRNLLFALFVLGSLDITDANMVIGLPVSAAASPKVVDRIKSLLSGSHEIVINGKPMSITISLGILSEPLGTYFQLVLDPTGRPVSSPFLNELVGIVDIGFRTVDVVALEGGKLATTKDSTLSGITNLFGRLCKQLEADHGKLRPNEISKVHTWLTGGCQEPLKIGGAYVRTNMPFEVATLKNALATQIMDEVQSLLANIRPDRIMMTGGGSALLRSELTKINSHLTFVQNPKFANAIGFYRAACARNS